jgi:L-aspartate oxidase
MRRGEATFLDARTALGNAFPERFPGVFAAARAFGIDPRETPIPVVAAAHYHMGGISVDGTGRTSIPGLWACGEASGTGFHGANRLASNSLLEALVFAGRVARDVGASIAPKRSPGRRLDFQPTFRGPDEDAAAVLRIRERMFADVGIERDERGLRAAIEAFVDERGRTRARVPSEMALVGLLVARAALRRRESRGGHFRLDYPTAAQTAEHSLSRLEDDLEIRIPA